MAHVKPKYHDVHRKGGTAKIADYPQYGLFRYRTPPINTWIFAGMIVSPPRARWTSPTEYAPAKFVQMSFIVHIEGRMGLDVNVRCFVYGKLGNRLHRNGLARFDQVVGMGRVRNFKMKGAKSYDFGVVANEFYVVPRPRAAVRDGDKYLVDAEELDQLSDLVSGEVPFDPVKVKRIIDRMVKSPVNRTYGTSDNEDEIEIEPGPPDEGETGPSVDELRRGDEGSAGAGGGDLEGAG